jgi:hypothetical protein
MTKVNIVTITAHTLPILTFSHCPPPPSSSPDIFCYRRLTAGLPQHISQFRLEAKRTALEQVRNCNEQALYYIEKFGLLCVHFSATSHSSSSRAAVTTSASLSVVLGQNLRKWVFFRDECVKISCTH